jgi:uncharacterized membrane protein YraQ (UPF0718 family)
MTAPFERRQSADRRRLSLAAYWQGAQLVRRQAGRRVTDRVYPIVDRHSPQVLVAALGVLVLCCCDSALTLQLIGHGAIEANPVMAALLSAGMGWFTTVKFLLTAVGIVVLAACSTMRLFRKIPGAVLLYTLLGCYAVLVAYEVWLLYLVR